MGSTTSNWQPQKQQTRNLNVHEHISYTLLKDAGIQVPKFGVAKTKQEFKHDQMAMAEALDETRYEMVEQTSLPPDDATASPAGVNQNTTILKPTPVHKWNVTFDGKSQHDSVNGFLQRIEELRVARNTSKAELFRSAVDLFDGKALLWYRSIKPSVSSWDQLIQALKRDFLPPDYDQEFIAPSAQRCRLE